MRHAHSTQSDDRSKLHQKLHQLVSRSHEKVRLSNEQHRRVPGAGPPPGNHGATPIVARYSGIPVRPPSITVKFSAFCPNHTVPNLPSLGVVPWCHAGRRTKVTWISPFEPRQGQFRRSYGGYGYREIAQPPAGDKRGKPYSDPSA